MPSHPYRCLHGGLGYTAAGWVWRGRKKHAVSEEVRATYVRALSLSIIHRPISRFRARPLAALAAAGRASPVPAVPQRTTGLRTIDLSVSALGARARGSDSLPRITRPRPGVIPGAWPGPHPLLALCPRRHTLLSVSDLSLHDSQASSQHSINPRTVPRRTQRAGDWTAVVILHELLQRKCARSVALRRWLTSAYLRLAASSLAFDLTTRPTVSSLASSASSRFSLKPDHTLRAWKQAMHMVRIGLASWAVLEAKGAHTQCPEPRRPGQRRSAWSRSRS